MICVGVVSKDVVEAALEVFEKPILIASDNQVGSYERGYTGFSINELRGFVGNNALIERDHGWNINSLLYDIKYCDVLHIDPFKYFKSIEGAADQTVNLIKRLYKENPQCEYEVGTEEAVFKYSHNDLNHFLSLIFDGLTEKESSQITFVVIQCGTGLDLLNQTNTGTFSSVQADNMCAVARYYNLLTKEHNGDFLTKSQLLIRKHLEIIVNVAPEFGSLHTRFLLEDHPIFKLPMYKLILKNRSYERWVGEDYTPLCCPRFLEAFGHYTLDVLSYPSEYTKYIANFMRQKFI